MSDLLKKFFQEYVAWVDAGAESGATFTRAMGLCSNLCLWYADAEDSVRESLDKEMGTLLDTYCTENGIGYFDPETKKFSSLAPFNSIQDGYGRDTRLRACHLNKQRLDFARKHAL